MKTTNPDVPREKHKQVGVYKAKKGLNVPEAYNQLLEIAIKTTIELDDKMTQQINQMAEQNNTTKSETIKDLIKTGLTEVKNK